MSEWTEKYGGGEYPAYDPNVTPPADPVGQSAWQTQYGGGQYDPYEAPQPVGPDIEDEDPTWGDYGRMVMSGGAQIGAGIGWLFNSTDWGKGLQTAGEDAAQWWMEDLSPQAQAAMQVEFTSRDRGELWTDAKWNKAKLTATQSLLGTMAGMGVGAVLTKGLGAAGMRTAVTTASGASVQIPSKAAGMIGYGAGEAAVAAPSVGSSVETEIMGMTHEDLYRDAADYRAIYDALENQDPEVRAERAKRLLAEAAAGDATALAFVSTFLLSAPFGTLMGRMTEGLPLTAGGGRFMGGVRGGAGEAGQEFLQSGAEQMAENIGMRQADPSIPITEGALEASVGGALAGGLMGAGPGLAASPERAVTEDTALPDEDSPLHTLANVPTAPPPVGDELDQTIDRVISESQLDQDKDDLEQAIEDVYTDLGTLKRDMDDQEEIEEAMRVYAEAEAEAEANVQGIIERSEAEFARQDEEDDMRRGPQMVALEGQRDRQLAEQRQKQAEEAEGFAAIEEERALVEAYGKTPEDEIEGVYLGEELQRARVEAAGQEPVDTERLKRGVPALNVPDPEVEYADERLLDPDRRGQIESMKSDLQVGGGSTLIPDMDGPGITSPEEATEFKGRTPSTNPAWFQSAAAAGEIPSVRWLWNAVDKALAGKRLGVKQKRAVQGMLDELESQEEEDAQQMQAERDRPKYSSKETDKELFKVEPGSSESQTDMFGAPTESQKQIAERNRKREEKERGAAEADTGAAGDLFTAQQTQEQDEGQTDLVDVTRAESNKELGVPEGMKLREMKPSELNELADETEMLITKFEKEGDTSGYDRTNILLSIQKLKMHKHARADELLEKMDDRKPGRLSDDEIVEKFYKGFYGTFSEPIEPREEVAGEPREFGRAFDANRGKQVFVDAYNDVQSKSQPAEKYLEEFRNAKARGNKREEGALGSRHDYLEARWFFDRGTKREVSWENVSAVTKALKINLGPQQDMLPAEVEDVSGEEGVTTIAEADGVTLRKEDGLFKLYRGGTDRLNQIGEYKDQNDATYEFGQAVKGNVLAGTTIMENLPDIMGGKAYEIEPRKKEVFAKEPKNRKVLATAKHDKSKPETDPTAWSLKRGAGIAFGSNEDAAASLAEMKEQVAAIAKEADHGVKVVLSLFDATGTWSKPWRDAGYTVIQYDASLGDDVMQENWVWVQEQIEQSGAKLYAIIAAPPCTSFASAGARWWGAQHDHPSESWVRKKYGDFAASMFESPLEYAQFVVLHTEEAIARLNPEIYALENPTGRMGRDLDKGGVGMGAAALSFDPWHFGDPYTKRTHLYGEFNTELEAMPVVPVEGSKMHKMGSGQEKVGGERSATPEGFSYAFFLANHTDKWRVDDTGTFIEDSDRDDGFKRPGKPPYFSEETESEKEARLAIPSKADELQQIVSGAKEKYELSSFEVIRNDSWGEIYISDIKVPTGMRGQQRGSKAMQEVIDFADRYGERIELEPAQSEVDLQPREGLDNFYTKLGFKPDEGMTGRWFRNPVERLDDDESGEVGDIPGWDDIDVQAQTSPENDQPIPTKGQKEAGNYKMAHITIKKIPITIENPAGSSRMGRRQPAHYGYIRLTEGKDGDHLDVFVNPKIQTDYDNKIFVIDQMDQKTGQFDEHKVMLGYTNQLAAVRDYKRAYDKNWKVGPVTMMDMATFKKWTQSRAKLTRPASEDSFFAQQSRESGRAGRAEAQTAGDIPFGTRRLRYKVPETPTFKRWFGKSKVVDKAGKPQLAYHGSQFNEAPIEVFEPQGSWGGWNHVGTWFSSQREHAERFVTPVDSDTKPGQLIPAYLKIENPFEETWETITDHMNNFLESQGTDRFSKDSGVMYRKHLQSLGYDGLIIRDWLGDNKPMQDVFVAFESNQIKSPDNQGSFRDDSRNIMYSKKERQMDLFETAKDVINAPNQKYVGTLLSTFDGQNRGPSVGPAQPGGEYTTKGMNELVNSLIRLQDRRVALERRAAPRKEPERRQYKLADLERDTEAVRASMPGAPVTILVNYKHAPDEVRAAMEASGNTNVGGVADPQTGEIYLFADKIESADEAVRTVIHEATHKGLRVAFGEELDPMLNDLFKNVPDKFKPGLQEIVTKYRLDVGNQADRLEAAEELLTHIAEHEPKNNIVQEFIAKIRQLLRKAGVEVGQWSDDEIISVINEAKGSLGRKADRIAGVTFDEDVVIDETGEVYTVEQDAEEILTQLKKRKDICEKVKNCL